MNLSFDVSVIQAIVGVLLVAVFIRIAVTLADIGNSLERIAISSEKPEREKTRTQVVQASVDRPSRPVSGLPEIAAVIAAAHRRIVQNQGDRE